LKHRAGIEEAERLGDFLGAVAGPGTVVLVSVDFTHNATREIAETNDNETAHAICALNIDNVGPMRLDCRGGVAALLRGMKIAGAGNAHLLEVSSAPKDPKDKESYVGAVSLIFTEEEK